MTPENKELPPPVASGDTTTLLSKSGAKGILCAKCNHVNRPSATKCSRCESHLHIKCNDCGARNERVYSRCQTCGRRLHKSVFEKMNAHVFKQGARVTPFQIVLLILFVVVAFYGVIIFGRLRLPIINH